MACNAFFFPLLADNAQKVDDIPVLFVLDIAQATSQSADLIWGFP
jgi:hypothetical protein